MFWREVGIGLPALSTNCEVDGVDAPPPLPISFINIVNVDTIRATPRGGARDVQANVT